MSATTKCPACGTSAAGNFCPECGAALAARSCRYCRAELSPGARFCHRCGQPAAPGAVPGAAPGGVAAAGAGTPRGNRTAWTVAAVLAVIAVAAIMYKVWSDRPQPAVPQMANPGAAAAAPGALGGPAPDISRMTPRERFDRLFNRVMTAAGNGDTTTVVNFTPMALGAYAQLDTVDADARYHAAVLQMQVGQYDAALALADTILAESPGHLFGYVVQGTVAELRNDPAALARARREFLAHDAAETAANRVEYLEHGPALDAFRAKAGGQ